MDLEGVDIKPAEGKVVLKFIDDVDDEAYDGLPSVSYEGMLAIVVAVGAKVTSARKGDTVITTPWARDGLKLGDNTYICDSYCIQGTVSK